MARASSLILWGRRRRFLRAEALPPAVQGIHDMGRSQSGLSLVELVVVMLILGVLAGVAVPRLNQTVISKHKAQACSRKIVTDLRRTRDLAITDAASNDQGYQLQLVGSSPYTSYQITNLDTGTVVDSLTVTPGVNVTCSGLTVFKFGPLGNILSGSGTGISVSAGGQTFAITFTTATGMIKCVQN